MSGSKGAAAARTPASARLQPRPHPPLVIHGSWGTGMMAVAVPGLPWITGSTGALRRGVRVTPPQRPQQQGSGASVSSEHAQPGAHVTWPTHPLLLLWSCCPGSRRASADGRSRGPARACAASDRARTPRLGQPTQLHGPVTGNLAPRASAPSLTRADDRFHGGGVAPPGDQCLLDLPEAVVAGHQHVEID